MSLNRYENQDVIVQLNEPQYGQLFTTEDLKILPHSYLVPDDPNFVSANISQVHIYSFYGDYIAGDHNAAYMHHDAGTNSLLIDLAETFREANIRRGSYIIALNLLRQLWGGPNNNVVVLREISPDRTELKLVVPPSVLSSGGFQSFKQTAQELRQNNIFNNVVLDFGFNHVSKVVLVKFDPNAEDIIYVKLYKPLNDDVAEKEGAWFGFEVMDPYVDTVILSTPITPAQTNQLRGPNYSIDTTQWASNATVFKTWNDLLDSNLSTTQRIIDSALSGSGTARLNIDYTDFNNYIFYSSAEERLANFKYKLGLIEGYNDTITALLASTASATAYISGSIDTNRRRIDQITTAFDHFERWLYYEGSGSTFTHDISGSLTPWPKYLNSGEYVLHHTTSSIASTWYDTHIASASVYDSKNYNRLWWSIPEHVVMDPGNTDYVTFVEMVSQHFDNLYSYVKALTDVHYRDEHPERGLSNDLLYPVAKSFGWNLQNTRQLSDLWFYKLGTNASNQYEYTGSMFSLSRENQTHQIWRRIVNNLPFLFKTKGTTRSVKAMMSIYGIPQTLISIKEYGGPSIEADLPSWIEDRFYYAGTFYGGNFIELNRRFLPASSGSWGGVARVPDTIEFSFRTDYTSSVSMSVWAIEDGTDRDIALANLMLVHKRYIDNTSSFSGSEHYGKLKFMMNRFNMSSNAYVGPVSSIAFSDYLPIFDGDAWTVKISTNYAFTQSSTAQQRISITASKATDYNLGTIAHSSSLDVVISGISNYVYAWGAGTGSINTPHKIIIGGTTSSMVTAGGLGGASSRFVGEVFGYKEYFDNLSDFTYRQHVLNPAAYNTDNESGSYYKLYRYFPLGLDQQRWDHTVYTDVSSSQPNRKLSFDTTASFVDWSGSQYVQYTGEREVYYIYPPSLGGNTFRSKKIRIEENRLTNALSPDARSERAHYDLSSFDTNRLAIVFAPSDHVNRDIANHMGGIILDEWIADPEYEYEYEYSELKRFGREYWQKYQQRNDINALIRIFSVYDYSFFEQIRQLIPGRADYIGGILIEPNLLERPKVVLSKRPTVEHQQYEDDISYIPNQSGEYICYEGELTASMVIDVDYSYNTGSISIKDAVEVTTQYNYLSASISAPFEISGASLHHFDSASQRTGLCGLVDTIVNRYSGSQCETGSMVVLQRIQHNCKYYKVIFHYSASGDFETRYLRQWYTAVSQSYGWYYSRSLEETGYQIDECGTRNKNRYSGCKLSGLDINIDSDATVDGGPVVTVIESNPNNLFIGGGSDNGNLLVET